MKTIHTRLVVNKASVAGAGGALGREDEVREAPAESTELCSPPGFILNDAEQTLQDFESSDKIDLIRIPGDLDCQKSLACSPKGPR